MAPGSTAGMVIEVVEDGAHHGVFEFFIGKRGAGENPSGIIPLESQTVDILTPLTLLFL
jgi:hypothetical protein